MRDKAALLLCLLFLNSALAARAAGDLLQFLDGTSLHGELRQMDIDHGVRWDTPEANNPIDFRPTHIDSIHFARADAVSLAPTCHLRFVNGDDLFGSITSLDNTQLGFGTWFGGAMTIPRASVQSITFLSKNYSILYEGPYDTNGWVFGYNTPPPWALRDGVFTATGPGILARDFKLSGSSTVEFDLAWNDTFELLVDLYTDALDHLDYANSSYVLELTSTQIGLRRVLMGIPRSFLGSVPMPNAGGKNKVHITIQSNKEDGSLAVFVDNVLAKRWKDENGFTATGSGILFQEEGISGAVVKLSNFKVSHWEGRFEPETATVTTNVDDVRFVNHDQAAGKIMGIADGKVTLAMGENQLQIPLQRVTQINFANTNVMAEARNPWEVRAHFPGGGSVSFQLEKWNATEVSGHSAIFGSLAFLPHAIRELEFNLDRPTAEVSSVNDKTFEGLDE